MTACCPVCALPNNNRLGKSSPQFVTPNRSPYRPCQSRAKQPSLHTRSLLVGLPLRNTAPPSCLSAASRSSPPYPLFPRLSMGGSSGLVLVDRLCVQTRVAPGSEYPYCDPAATLRASSDSLRPRRRFYPLGLWLSRTARSQSRTNAESGQAADLSH